jgi:thioredoxin-related protein
MSLSRVSGFLQFEALEVEAGRIGRWIRRMAVASLVVAALAAPALARDRWLTNYDDAMAAAERTGRPVLTIFTGSDWCPHCVTLEKNVLDSRAFLDWATDRVVLLMIDLPQQGLTQDERQARSRVCIKYGVRTFPNTVLIAPGGAKIMGQSGYHGQSPEAWLASVDKHVPAPALAETPADDGEDGKILSSLGEAVETARDSRRPMLLLVSRPSDSAARTRVATLIQDPEFESLAKENFVVAQVHPRDDAEEAQAGVPEDLLGGQRLPAEAVEVIVTEDGETPIHAESGSQPATRIVSGLRRFLANRHAARQGESPRR